MSKLAVVALNLLMAFVAATRSSRIGPIGQPTFLFIEKNTVEIKYPKESSEDSRSLFLCWNCTKTGLFLAKLACFGQSICPDYKVVEHCQSSGHYILCHIDYVSTNVILRGYVSQNDSKNVILHSKVATYMTNETTKAPRAVANLNITHKDDNLILRWTPSDVFLIDVTYKQWVFCKAVEDNNAKALRKMLEFPQSTLVVHSSLISAVTKYQCCIQVENDVTSIMSKRTCQNITTPEQAPSAAPVIVCGNNTDECPSEVKGIQRNITILFEPVKKSARNGKIIRHVVWYRNDSSGNFTSVEFNGSATSLTLVGLSSRKTYWIFMKSCTTVACSPPSNTVEFSVIKPSVTAEKGPKKVTTIVSSISIVVVLIIIAIILFLIRSRRLELRGRLPELKLPTHLEYSYPDNYIETPIYHRVIKNPESRVNHQLDAVGATNG